MDANGNCVTEAAGSAGQLYIPQANLWWPYPGTPYLYQAEVHYGEDCYTEEFGFRTVEVKGTKFLINGEPFYFKGFSKYEDSPFYGRGLDLCLNVKDINLLHWEAASYAWNMELDFWKKIGKPVMMTEYGADTLAGLHNCSPEMWSEEFQVEFYKMYSKAFDGRDFFIGEHAWNFADYATLQGCMRADGNRKGIFTRERRPKMIAHYFRERWDKIPNCGYKTSSSA